MIIFLLIYCAIYGGMHFFLLWKIWRACGKVSWMVLLAGLWCIVMMAAPILVRALERTGVLWPARIFALVGHTWIAVIFWFCMLGYVLEVWNLAVTLIGLAKPAAGKLFLHARPMLAVCGVVILLATVWGVIEARRVRVVEVRLSSTRLPPDSDPIRLAHLSDLHLSLTVGERHLKRVLDLIRKAEPDMIVATGDILDLSFENSDDLARSFADLEAPLGKFAVLGNHEFYAGLENSLTFHEAAGFRVLRGESVTVGDRLRLVGVDYAVGRRRGEECKADEDAAFSRPAVGSSSSPRPLTILLKHEPEARASSLGRFDLQLSGHSHGGQIFPFHFFVRRRFPLGAGLHQLENGSALYVNRGAGTWGPPMRLFAPPEIALIIIEPVSVFQP